ncbi:MAG: nucleoside-diphosphate kinase [Chlamydiales bacterium]|nr:nucleoside-diphosphate kinase [Chlamydiales bacterium]
MKKFFTLFSALFALTASINAEQTLSIIKPDAVAADHIGAIIDRFEQNGLKVVALRMEKLSKKQAQEFYAVHKGRPFYNDLVAYMTSGPVVIQVLDGKDAVAVNRKLMGATNPKQAEKGTIRADFGTGIEQNAVHGSDSLENAKKEISFFFKPDQIYKN